MCSKQKKLGVLRSDKKKAGNKFDNEMLRKSEFFNCEEEMQQT